MSQRGSLYLFLKPKNTSYLVARALDAEWVKIDPKKTVIANDPEEENVLKRAVKCYIHTHTSAS